MQTGLLIFVVCTMNKISQHIFSFHSETCITSVVQSPEVELAGETSVVLVIATNQFPSFQL